MVFMHIINKSIPLVINGPFAPLDEIKVLASGHVSVTDGEGRQYFDCHSNGETDFMVGGALGVHTIQVTNPDGQMIDERTFIVDATSGVDDKEGKFKEYLTCWHTR